MLFIKLIITLIMRHLYFMESHGRRIFKEFFTASQLQLRARFNPGKMERPGFDSPRLNNFEVFSHNRVSTQFGIRHTRDFNVNLLLLLPTVYRHSACFSLHPCLCLILWKIVSLPFSGPSSAPLSCR